MSLRASSGLRASRRAFIKNSGSALVVVGSLSACSMLETSPADEQETSQPKGDEAPELAKQVESGDLEPVAERLPAQPLVVEPHDRVGIYGGEWSTALSVSSPGGYIVTIVGYEPLVRWAPDWSDVLPNIAESFDVSPDGTRYEFVLREGMKWSDGAPFTADDIVFAYEDILANSELSPAGVPSLFTSEGQPATLEKLDDYRIRFTFASPRGLFLEQLATPSGLALTTNPRHYLQEFHSDYNPDAAAIAKDEGFEDWTQLLQSRGGGAGNIYGDMWQSPIPTVGAWMLTRFLEEGSRVVAERNPYYWKVDADGSQLPYIDKVVFEAHSTVDTLLLSVLAGEVDMHALEFNTLQNRPVVSQSRESGDYSVFDLVHAEMNTTIICLNLTHPDPVLREIFRNRDFRIGLSHAINRPEIIDSAYQRQGEPWQAAPRAESDFFDEELARQYTEYDPDLANEYLDSVLPDRDEQGFRLRPDGKRLKFAVEIPGDTWPEHPAVLELVSGYWKDVGVDMSIKNESRTLFQERRAANEHDASVWHGSGGLDVDLKMTFYFPFDGESAFAVPWAEWFTSEGAGGEEPPAAAQRQMELYGQVMATSDKQARQELIAEILRIAKEEFYAMGISLKPDGYGVVSNTFHNVPASMPRAWLYPTPGPSNPEQYFVE